MATLAAILYLPSLDNRFVYDDTINIVRNPSIRKLSNTPRFFTAAETATANMSFRAVYRPLSTLSYAIDYALFRLQPRGYMLHNLLLHALATGLCVAAVGALTGSAWLAAVSGMAFGLHPVQTEPVNWATGRATLLFAMFYLLALRLYVAAARRSALRRAPEQAASAKRRAAGWSTGGLWSLSWLAAAAALWSKEMAVTLPVALALVEWLLPPDRGATPRRRLWRLIPYTVLVVAYVGVRAAVLGGVMARTEYWGGSVLTTVLMMGRVVARYAQLLLAPVGQNLEHVVPGPEHWWDPASLTGLMLAAVALATAWRFRRRRPVLALGLLWMGAVLLPVLNIIPFYGLIAERHLYLVLLGFGLVLGEALSAWLRLPVRARETLRGDREGTRPGGSDELAPAAPKVEALSGVSPSRARIALCLIVGIGAAYAAASLARGQVWSDEVALWEDTAAKSPSKLKALNNLGLAYLRENRVDEAVRQFERALEIYPRSAGAHVNLGLVHLARKEPRRAVEPLLRALEENPRHLDAHRYLTRAYLRLSSWQEAEAVARQGLEVREDLDIRYLLGAALLKQDRVEGAEHEFLAVLGWDPEHADALRQMGIIRQRQRRLEESERFYRQALSVKPVPDLYFNLAILALERRDYAAAATGFARARQLAPQVAAVALRQAQAEILRSLRGKVRPEVLEALRTSRVREHAAAARLLREIREAGEIAGRLQPARDLRTPPEVRLALLATLSLLERSQGHLGAARSLYEEMLDAGGEAAVLHLAIGEMAAQAGDQEAAEEHLHQALALDPTLLQAYGRLGFLARLRGEPAEALALYNRALSIQSDHGASLDGRCVSLYSLERWVHAQRCFEQRADAMVDHPQAFYYLGRLYQRLGDTDRAQAMFARHKEIRRRQEGSGSTMVATHE